MNILIDRIFPGQYTSTHRYLPRTHHPSLPNPSLHMSAAGQKRKADRKTKQKLKKEKRRLEKLERSRACAIVQSANIMPGTENTPMNFLTAAGFNADSPFRNYTKNDLSVHLAFGSAASLSEEELNTMYELTKTNMLDQYNRAAETDPTDWTWNEKKKRAEMGHEDARYLVARATPSGLVGETKAEAMGELVGFAHVRFEMEGVVEVCYVYELQLAETAQKHGLGKRMMQLVELSSAKLKMKWVMLTVFKANVAAGNFYQKLKYELDET